MVIIPSFIIILQKLVLFIFYSGRSIVVDWAIPKNKYETIHTKENGENTTLKEEVAVENTKEEDIKEEVLSDVEKDVEDTSKTIDDYLTLDTTKIEDDNFVDFETTGFE